MGSFVLRRCRYVRQDISLTRIALEPFQDETVHLRLVFLRPKICLQAAAQGFELVGIRQVETFTTS